MQKSSWIILAVMVAAIVAPKAQAGSINTYTLTYSASDADLYGFTFTTVPISITGFSDALLPAADISSYSLTGSRFVGCMLTGFILYRGGTTINLIGGCEQSGLSGWGDGFKLADYITPGTYTGVFDTMQVTAVTATPEPSSLLLFGTSLLGLAPFRRKLFGK